VSRVIHHRAFGLDSATAHVLARRLEDLTRSRTWSGAKPFLASRHSRDLFATEYLRHVRLAEDPAADAAGYLKTGADETDALVNMLFWRDFSASSGVRVTLRDEDNPLAKLRRLEFIGGLLPSGRQLEEILARRPVIKKVDGAAILFYAPSVSAGEVVGSPAGAWGYGLLGLKAEAPTLVEAEREALKILRAMRHLGL